MAMNEEKRKEIDRYLADTIMEWPYGFMAGDEHYCLYPVTLGKIYLLQRNIEQLGIDKKRMQDDISLEALRLAKEKPEECLRIIYVHTCRTKYEVYDTRRLLDTTEKFRKEMSEEDIAALMIIVLSSERTDVFIKHLGIDRELHDMREVMKVKEQSDKNSFSFGGVSIYGSFIHPLLELGMSWDEIMWERSYTNLRLLLADKVNSIYLTDEERKNVRISRDRRRVDGDDKDAVLQAIRSQSWD